jgi:uncharacterized membrane protein
VSSARRSGILGAASVVLIAAYPFAVYLLMYRGSIRLAGLALLAVLVLRFLMPGPRQAQGLAALVAGAVFALCIAVTNSETLARLYPVGLSAAMLAAFGFTLLQPPSMVERIARATGTSMDEAGVRYTRNVTIIWCVFFLANGCIALATALAASRETWALYNGLLSYLLAGAIFVGERIVRPIFRRRLSATTSH